MTRSVMNRMRVRPRGNFVPAVVAPPLPPTPPSTINVSFGASELQGFGGFPTSEAAGSSFTGAFGGFFTVDARGHLVPAVSGSVSTYGGAWTPPISSLFTIVGASGVGYIITVIPNCSFVRENDASGKDSAVGNQLNLILAQSGLFTDNAHIYIRDGVINPTGARNDLTLHSSYESLVITIGSETVDVALDNNGNPRLAHGATIGGLNVYTNNNRVKLVLRDLQFYHDNAACPMPALLSQVYRGGSSGGRVTNCYFAYGPSVTDATLGGSAKMGFGVSYWSVDHCRFYHCGVSISLIGASNAAVYAQWNVIHNIVLDAIEYDGVNFDISDNWMFDFIGNSVRDTLHGDACQLFGQFGDATVATAGTILRNGAMFDNGVTKTQGTSFMGDNASAGSYRGVIVRNNFSILCGATGTQITNQDNIDYSFNACLLDMTRQASSNVQMIVNPAYAGGGNLQGNVSNHISFTNQTGATLADNIEMGTATTDMDAAFPALRAFLTGSVFTFAAAKVAMIPANRRDNLSPVGMKKANGTWIGPFKGDGSVNDGL